MIVQLIKIAEQLKRIADLMEKQMKKEDQDYEETINFRSQK